MSGTVTPVTRLYLASGLRDFGDGFVAILLPVYLAALGSDAIQVGLAGVARTILAAVPWPGLFGGPSVGPGDESRLRRNQHSAWEDDHGTG